jgi:hypothetical protein
MPTPIPTAPSASQMEIARENPAAVFDVVVAVFDERFGHR